MTVAHAVLIGALAAAPAHPLHTTLTTVTWHGDRHALEVAVRVFTQDLADAVQGRGSDSAACRYATAAVSVRDGAGGSLPVAGCVTQRSVDVTWIRWTVPIQRPERLQLRNALLFERFSDQVNIVQAGIAGATRTILFTSGDGPKPLT